MEAANQKDSGLGGVFGFAVTHTALRYILAQVKQVSVADLLCIIFLHMYIYIIHMYIYIIHMYIYNIHMYIYRLYTCIYIYMYHISISCM